MGNDFGVILCADDYGYRPGVSATIRTLAKAGRLSATSALVNFPDWADAARDVRDLAGIIDVGLHLNLVEGAPLGPMPVLAPQGTLPGIGRLIRLAMLRQVPMREIADETRRQIDTFTAAAGRPPDFLDGHQHAHALPGIRDAVLDVWRNYGRAPVRDPGDRMNSILARGVAIPKALLLAGLTTGFAKAAARRGLPRNQSFSGFYDLLPRDDLPELFSRFMTAKGEGHLVMCHPGPAAFDDTDPIAAARAHEAEFLAGPSFLAMLREQGVSLTRFSALANR